METQILKLSDFKSRGGLEAKIRAEGGQGKILGTKEELKKFQLSADCRVFNWSVEEINETDNFAGYKEKGNRRIKGKKRV